MSILGASAGTSAAPLDGFITFDDPYRCVPGKDLDAVLGGIIRWQQSGETYKGILASPPVPAAFGQQVGTPTLAVEGSEYRATLPLHGTWQGLPLHSLIVVHWVESEGGFYLVFDATPEQVRDAANRAGFRLPTSGSEYRDEGVIGVNVGVESYEQKSALHCISG